MYRGRYGVGNVGDGLWWVGYVRLLGIFGGVRASYMMVDGMTARR